MTPGPGIEPRTHWWEASALTTVPTLLLMGHLAQMQTLTFYLLKQSDYLLSISEVIVDQADLIEK